MPSRVELPKLVTVATALLVWLATLLMSAPASAQTDETAPPQAQPSALSVSPAIIDNTLDAGQSFTAEITLGNAGNVPVTVRTSVQSLEPEQRIDPDFVDAINASAWFADPERRFVLQPNERRQVTFSVQAPPDAEPGGHYATIYFEALNTPSGRPAAGATVNARVGVVVFMTIRGDIVEDLKPITPVRAQAITTDKKMSFSFVVRNDGNVHQLPSAVVKVRDVRGEVIETVEVPTGIVLPHAEREFAVEWDAGNRVGLYRANAIVVTGSQDTILLVDQTWFGLAPLFVVIPAVALLLLVVVLLLIRRRRVRKHRKEARDKVLAAITEQDSASRGEN